MKKHTTILCSLLILLLFAGCSPSTKLLGKWKREEFQAKKFNKIAVVMMAPKMSTRAIVESAMAMHMHDEGLKAIGAFGLFPQAGKAGVMEEHSLEEIKQIVREKVTKNEIDALLIISLLDEQKEERYIGGSSISVVAPVYDARYPFYNESYYGYYAYNQSTMVKPGYYETSSTYFVESNLYDVATEKLIWSAQTKTEDVTSIQKESEMFVRIIISNLLKDGVVLTSEEEVW